MAPQGEPGRTIAVLAPNGGGGSSTLAVNVAAVLAKEHKTSLLFDLKLASGDLAALLDLKPTHNLAELCQNVARMDRIMFERSLVTHASGIHLLAPPRAFADIGYVTAEGVAQALYLARSLFPYVVVDLDHSFREEQLQVLRQADVILLVLRLDFASLCNGRRTLDYLEQLGIARDRLRVVVNRYGQPKEIPAAKAEEALGCKIAHYVPDDPKTVNRAHNNGVPAVLESPRAPVSRSVARLASSVNGRHNNNHK
jgi:pilus assembly protein CpaE